MSDDDDAIGVMAGEECRGVGEPFVINLDIVLFDIG